MYELQLQKVGLGAKAQKEANLLLQEEAKAAHEVAKRLSEELEEAVKASTSKTARIKELEESIALRESEVTSLKSRFEQQLLAMNDNFSELQRDLDGTRRAKGAVEKEVASLQGQLSALNAEKEALETRLGEQTRLAREAQGQRKETEELLEKTKRLSVEVKVELQRQVDEAKVELANVRSNLAEVLADTKRTQTRLEEDLASLRCV